MSKKGNGKKTGNHKIKFHIPKRKVTNSDLFIGISLTGFLLTLLFLQISHGTLISKIFFHDELDTGMDFFHSIEYTRGLSPYEYWETLYPPLANCLFYFLYHMIPRSVSDQWADSFMGGIAARGSRIDLRTAQAPLLLFILSIILACVFFGNLCHRYFNKSVHVGLITFCALFSYGMLYAFERGNIVILAFLCSMFFLCYKDNSNEWLQELALIMLAIGAGLKIYPAFLGLLLLYDKEYHKAARTVLYGIVFFLCPFMAFREKLAGLPIFLNKLFSFQSVNGVSYSGFSGAHIFNLLAHWFYLFLGIKENTTLILNIGSKLNYIIAALMLVNGFFLKKKWQKVLACCMAMFLYSSQGIYITVFMLLPIFVMIQEEDQLVTAENKTIMILMSLFVTLLPLHDLDNMVVSMKHLRFQLILLILILYVLIKGFIELHHRLRKRKEKN